MSDAPTFRKGDTAFYTVRDNVVRARVQTVHRDGTLTVGALFYVDADGNDLPGYLGFKYARLDPGMLCAGPIVANADVLRKALQPFADVAAKYGQPCLDKQAEDNRPHQYAKAVMAAAEQTGWNVWADAIAAISKAR